MSLSQAAEWEDSTHNAPYRRRRVEHTNAPDLTEEVKIPNPAPIFVGTYSHVFKGIYRGEYMAVKVLRPLPGSLESMLRKVSRERGVWSRMEHPNIVPLCGYTEESELFGPFGALISPWYANGDSAQFLHRHGASLDIDDRIKMWRGVVDGLCYLHTHDPIIVHGDIKPGNILIDDHLEPKICDFGLAHIFLEEGHSGMTTSSEHTGTERYLAHELVLFRDGGRPTTASDVWALGCVGLEFLFLQVPYANRKNNRSGLIFKDIKDGIPPAYPPAALDTEISDLWSILQSCWNIEPGSRIDVVSVSTYLSKSNEAPCIPPAFYCDDWICVDVKCRSKNIGENEECFVCGSPRYPINGSQGYDMDTSSSTNLLSERLSTLSIQGLQDSGEISPFPPSDRVFYHPRNSLLLDHSPRPPSNLSFTSGHIPCNLNAPPTPWATNEPVYSIERSHPQRFRSKQGSKRLIPQAGDWFCDTCGYLNWKRRRVCAVCYPHAQGNIGAANSMMAPQERIEMSPRLSSRHPPLMEHRQYHQPNSRAPPSPFGHSASPMENPVLNAPFIETGGMTETGMRRFSNQGKGSVQVLANEYGYNFYPLSLGGIRRSTLPPSTVSRHHMQNGFNSSFLSTIEESNAPPGAEEQTAESPLSDESVDPLLSRPRRRTNSNSSHSESSGFEDMHRYSSLPNTTFFKPVRPSRSSSVHSLPIDMRQEMPAHYSDNLHEMDSTTREFNRISYPQLTQSPEGSVDDFSDHSSLASSQPSIHHRRSSVSSVSTSSSAFIEHSQVNVRRSSDSISHHGREGVQSHWKWRQPTGSRWKRSPSQSSICSLGFDHAHI